MSYITLRIHGKAIHREDGWAFEVTGAKGLHCNMVSAGQVLRCRIFWQMSAGVECSSPIGHHMYYRYIGPDETTDRETVTTKTRAELRSIIREYNTNNVPGFKLIGGLH